MEILTFVQEGTLAHRDSLGSGSEIRPGDVQRMTAGSGILHSEMNPSADEPVRLHVGDALGLNEEAELRVEAARESSVVLFDLV